MTAAMRVQVQVFAVVAATMSAALVAGHASMMNPTPRNANDQALPQVRLCALSLSPYRY